jgi:hypothetical protein
MHFHSGAPMHFLSGVDIRFFRDQGILFPRRLRSGPDKGQLLWALPQHSRILQVLHNPRYAGAFVYGRQRTRHHPDGSIRMETLPRSEWQFVMPGAHRGYIDWDRFEANQRRLLDNSRAYGIQRRSGPVREGPALLQGRVLCGLCGERMGVHYSREHGRIVPISMSAKRARSAAAVRYASQSLERSSIRRSAHCSSN